LGISFAFVDDGFRRLTGLEVVGGGGDEQVLGLLFLV